MRTCHLFLSIYLIFLQNSFLKINKHDNIKFKRMLMKQRLLLFLLTMMSVGMALA